MLIDNGHLKKSEAYYGVDCRTDGGTTYASHWYTNSSLMKVS